MRSPVVLTAARLAAAWVSLVTSMVGIAACSSTAATPCHIGADCASGVCGAGGICVSPDDAGPTIDGAAIPDGQFPMCTPNHDGTIARNELAFVAGAHEPFRIAASATVDTAGVAQGDGTRHWDLTAMLSGDHTADVATIPPTGQWWAAKYPTANYAAKLSDSQDLLGLFQVTPTALLMVAVVSPADGLTRTELAYAPAVTVLQFPLAANATWSTSSTVTGVTSGVGSIYTEAYVSKVDASGVIATPYGPFPVLRVSTVLTRTVGVLPTVVRTFSFVAECYGVVATIASNANETATEFTSASEVRRLSTP